MIACLVVGCGEDGEPTPAEIYEELIAGGALRYQGQFPAEVTRSGGIAEHTWDPAADNGPRCIGSGTAESERFTITTQERTSNNLMIFLQGGGLCSNLAQGACEREGIPFVAFGILSPGADHPYRDYDLGYVPYCDGSLFLGDTTNIINGEETVQRGRQNLLAALDAIQSEFPNPERIALVGISGGGFATIFAGPVVRLYWPDAEVSVVNDSGIGITRGEMEPEFVDDLLEEFDASEIIPPSCVDCFGDGHAINVVDWVLERDPNIRMANISHIHDNVISERFLEVPREFFEAELMRKTAELSERWGPRYGTYFIEGVGHTALIVPAIPGFGEGNHAEMFEWLAAFDSRDPEFADHVQMGTLSE